MKTRKTTILMAAAVVLIAASAVAQWNPATQKYTPGPKQVVLYDYRDCKAEPYMVVRAGANYPDFRSYDVMGGNWNDRASCIVLGPNTKFVGYQDINFRGSALTFTSGANEIKVFAIGGSSAWDNKISSCKVY